MDSSAPRPTREIHHADALEWLPQHAPFAGASFITSLPDISEMPERGFDGWRRWFEDAAGLVFRVTPDDGVAIFYQSDVRHGGRWVDKGYLVARAAETAGHHLLFHKIVCRKPPGTITPGRASYSHMLAFSRMAIPVSGLVTADVLPEAGLMTWSRAMGVNACFDACLYLKRHTNTRTIIDPFCGYGTVPAVANALGFDAIGIDSAIKKCRRARALEIDPKTRGLAGANESAP